MMYLYKNCEDYSIILLFPFLLSQRKHEEHAITIEDAPHESSASRTPFSSSSSSSTTSSHVAKPFSHTPPPPKTPTPSPGMCPSSRQSPCYHSPSRRPHPPNPLTPAPSPAAAAPRSPALSPAPSHLSKGLERGSDRGEGQPPQDYPQSLEPGECVEVCLMNAVSEFKELHRLNSQITKYRQKTGLGVRDKVKTEIERQSDRKKERQRDVCAAAEM